MLSIQNNTTPIDIGVLEVSSQNRAILGFFFESSGAELFNEVSIDKASAFIIDYDFPGAKESWEEISLTTQKPGIVLSVNEISLPNTIWVKKPITAKLLSDAGAKICEMISSNNEQVLAPSIEEAPSLDLELTAVKEQEFVVNHKETQAELPTLEIPVETLALVTEEKATTHSPIATDTTNSPSSISDFSVLSSDKTHETSETIIHQSNPVEGNDDLDEIDSLINSLSIENQDKQEIEPLNIDTHNIEVNVLDKTQTALEEPTLEIDSLLNSLNSESNSNIEFISDSEGTLAEESVSIDTENTQETQQEESSSEFFDELILETSPEDTSDVQKIREDIITASTQSSSNNESMEETSSMNTLSNEEANKVVFDEELSDSNTLNSDTKSDTDTDTDLQAMLDEIQKEMEVHDTSNLNTGGASDISSAGEQEYETTSAQERWALLCGDKNRTKSSSEIKKDAYKLNDHLLANLLDTIEEAKITQQVMRIKYEDMLIIIDTEIDTIYTDTSIHSDEYAKICFDPVDHDLLKVHSLDSSETRMVHKKIEAEPNNAYTIESFIWTTSLLTSRGRLLEHTNTNKVIGLKHWPNLTRIENFPHVMHIAAVFSKHPGNLLDISKWLNIPQCYVFAFYNAAFSLNMIDLNTDVLNKNNIKKVSFSFSKKGKSENRGLFSRLLSKIKG